MSRIRINAYGVSESVNLLTAEIRSILAETGGELAASRTVLRLNRNLQNSRFYGREGDLIVNWGSAREIPERVIGDALLLNNPRAVNTASDKLKAFAALTAGGVKTVPSTSDREEAQAWVDAGHHVFCRRELRGHSGSGIVVVANHTIEDAGNVEIVDTLPRVPLYTRGVSAQHREYRIHVFKGVILFIQQKRRASGYRENPNYSNVVRNHGNGWVYGHNQITPPNAEVLSEAVKAVEAIGLDFGAVDVLSRQDEAWVLEVNTAPGLTGDTNRANYANAIIAVSNGQQVQGIEQPEASSLEDIFPDWQEAATEELTGATADGQELLEAETPRFQEGNRVRLSEAGRNEFEHGHWNPHDEVGYVIEVHNGLTVAWDNGEYNTYNAESLELVPVEEDRIVLRTLNEVSSVPAESSTESPLSVGDRVILSDVGRRVMFHSRQNPHDFAGTVSGTDLYPMEYSVIWDNGEYNVYRREHLVVINEEYTTVSEETTSEVIAETSELVPLEEDHPTTRTPNEVSRIHDGSSTESPLSIGDRVTLSDVGRRVMLYPHQNPNGFAGTVSGTGSYPMEYSVIWDNAEYNTYEYNIYNREHLDLILDTDEQTPTETINEEAGSPEMTVSSEQMLDVEPTTAIEDSSQLAVRTRVRLSMQGRQTFSDASNNPHNEIGSITRILDGSGYPYEVVWDTGTSNVYREEDLIEAPEIHRNSDTTTEEGGEQMLEGLLPEGTRVQMSQEGRETFSNDVQNPHLGIGTITRNRTRSEAIILPESDVFPYLVEWDNGHRNSYRVGDIEVFDVSQIPSFSVGDHVRLSITGRIAFSDTAGNPHTGSGVVSAINEDPHQTVRVVWGPNQETSYRSFHLEMIDAPSVEEDQSVDDGILPIGTVVRLSPIAMQRYMNTRSNPHNVHGTIRSNRSAVEGSLFHYSVDWSNGSRNTYREDDLVNFTPDSDFSYNASWDNGFANIYREELLVVGDQPPQDTRNPDTTTEDLPEIVVGSTVTRSQRWLETGFTLPRPNELGVVEEVVRAGIYRVRWDNAESVSAYPRRALELVSRVPQTTSANVGEIVVGSTVRMLRTHMRVAAPVGALGVVRSILGGGLYLIDWEGQAGNNDIGCLRGELELVSGPETQTTFTVGMRVRLSAEASNSTPLGILPEGVCGIVQDIYESGHLEVCWDYRNLVTCHRVEDMEVIPATQVTATFDIGARVRFAEGALIDLDRGALPEEVTGVITYIYEDGSVEINWDSNSFFSRQRIEDLVPAPTARMPVTIFEGSTVRLTPACQAVYSNTIQEGATGIVHYVHQDNLFEIHWNHEDLVTCHPLYELELAVGAAEEEEQAAEFIPYTDGVYYILETDDGRFVGEYSAECRGFWDTQGEMRYEDEVTVITEVNLHA